MIKACKIIKAMSLLPQRYCSRVLGVILPVQPKPCKLLGAIWLPGWQLLPPFLPQFTRWNDQGRLLGGGDFWRMSGIQTCSHGQILFFFFNFSFFFKKKKRKFFPFLEDQLKDCFLLTRSCWLELFMFSQHPHWQKVINSAQCLPV